jgi:hypothetical protein
MKTICEFFGVYRSGGGVGLFFDYKQQIKIIISSTYHFTITSCECK